MDHSRRHAFLRAAAAAAGLRTRVAAADLLPAVARARPLCTDRSRLSDSAPDRDAGEGLRGAEGARRPRSRRASPASAAATGVLAGARSRRESVGVSRRGGQPLRAAARVRRGDRPSRRGGGRGSHLRTPALLHLRTGRGWRAHDRRPGACRAARPQRACGNGRDRVARRTQATRAADAGSRYRGHDRTAAAPVGAGQGPRRSAQSPQDRRDRRPARLFRFAEHRERAREPRPHERGDDGPRDRPDRASAPCRVARGPLFRGRRHSAGVPRRHRRQPSTTPQRGSRKSCPAGPGTTRGRPKT